MRIDRDGGVLVLTLDRPERLNAMNGAQWSALLEGLRTAEDDPEIRAVVIRGEGRIFCAGNDIKETSAFAGKAEARAYFLDLMVPALAAMATSRLPIVGSAHGMALGAGFELLQFCDVVVAADTCSFRLPETRIGLWATVFLGSASYSANRRGTQWLALTGEAMSAQEAEAAHFVSRVVPEASLEEETMRVARTIASRGPNATAVSKRFANYSLVNEGLKVVREALSELIEDTLWSDEGVEGVAAFTEKRDPVF